MFSLELLHLLKRKFATIIFHHVCIHLSIIPAISVCVSVCLYATAVSRRPPGRSHWNLPGMLLGTHGCAFSRFDIDRTSGSQVTAIYLSTNDKTRCYDVTNDVTINVYLFIFYYFFCTIETCQEYCWGPTDVPFRGLILIGQAVPKLRSFICRPMTRHGAMISRMTSQLMSIYLFIFARLTSQFFFFVWYDVTGPLFLTGAFSRFDIVLHPFQLFPKCIPSVSQGLKAVFSQGLN